MIAQQKAPLKKSCLLFCFGLFSSAEYLTSATPNARERERARELKMRALLLVALMPHAILTLSAGFSHTLLRQHTPLARTNHIQAIAAPGIRYDKNMEAGSNARTAALMEKHQFPLGLAQQAVVSGQYFPNRYWIVDNSGSMRENDGNLLGKDAAGASKIVRGTRWQEISADIAVVAEISHDIGARTEFLPLNGAIRPLTIQGTNAGDVAEVTKGLAALEPQAGYTTPLAAATARVYLSILPKVPALKKNQQQACVVIATDGKPTDSGFQQALKQLQTLPVWVVVRLCTDDDEVVDYYNGLDNLMEGGAMDVLDDLRGEAREVCQFNRWLTYGQPLHIARVNHPFPTTAPVALLDPKLRPGSESGHTWPSVRSSLGCAIGCLTTSTSGRWRQDR